MNQLQKIATVLSLIDSLAKKGSHCSETYVQKAVFFLQEVTKIETKFDYTFYKHSPYSFELRDLLSEMRAENLLEFYVQEEISYPCLCLTEFGRSICASISRQIERFDERIQFVVDHFGGRPVGELERLATVLFYSATHEEITPEDVDEKAEEIHRLRPYFSSPEQAKEAIMQMGEVEVLARAFVA